jgi:hypothetical protein
MDVANRIFGVVTHSDHLQEEVRKLVLVKECAYWRAVLRIAALRY